MTEAEQEAFAANAVRLTEFIRAKEKNTVVSMMQPELAVCDPKTFSLTLAFPGQPWECNPTGAIHGGMVSVMFDTAMGIAAYAYADELTPTISLTTSYLRPAPGEGTLHVHATVTMAGRGIMYASAEMWEAQSPERIVATAQGVFRRLHGSEKNPLDKQK